LSDRFPNHTTSWLKRIAEAKRLRGQNFGETASAPAPAEALVKSNFGSREQINPVQLFTEILKRSYRGVTYSL
jgi:hypothetical protein